MRISEQTSAVLEALEKCGRSWSYGYDVSKGTGLKSGTLYPILARLHDEGWLETKWEPSCERGRPPRHLYRLTSAGAVESRNALETSAAKARASRYAIQST